MEYTLHCLSFFYHRRSTLFSSAKKYKRSSISSISERLPGETKSGVILRLRSSADVAFEAVKRVVKRRSYNPRDITVKSEEVCE